MMMSMHEDRWYFSKEQLKNSPSKRFGIDADKELSYRQTAANFIHTVGLNLPITQLCINTAIVYMHRFYVFHPFTIFHWSAMATACIFLACKNEEQPRKLDHILHTSLFYLYRQQGKVFNYNDFNPDKVQIQDLLRNEETLLKTLGFDTAIDHPHAHILRCCNLVKASKDLAQTAYYMASNSLLLTTLCVQYKPTIIACFCIHLACKWSKWELKDSVEGKPWFWYVDQSATTELLEQVTSEFLAIFDKCPSYLKKPMTTNNEKDKNKALANYYSFQHVQSSIPAMPSNDKHQCYSGIVNTKPVPSKPMPPSMVFQPPTRTNGVLVDHKFVVPFIPIPLKDKPAPIISNQPLAPVQPKDEIPTTLNKNILNELLLQRPKSIPKPPEIVIRQEIAKPPEPLRNQFSVGRDKNFEVITSVLKKMTKKNDLNIFSMSEPPRKSPSKVKKPSIFSPIPENEPHDMKPLIKSEPKPFIIKTEPELYNKPELMSPEILQDITKFDAELIVNSVGPTGVVEMDEETGNSKKHKKKKNKRKEEKREKKKHKKDKKHKDKEHRHRKHKDERKKPESIRVAIPKEKIKQIPVGISTPHSPPRGINFKIPKERIGGYDSDSKSSLRIKICKYNGGAKREHSPVESIPKRKHKKKNRF